MDADTPTEASTSAAAERTRKERGPIATTACDHCRNRKQKCDEQKPCSNCQRNGIECKYRPPPPTKKDRTLVEILDVLKSIDRKVDEQSENITDIYKRLEALTLRVPPLLRTGSGGDGSSTATLQAPDQTSPILGPEGPYPYASGVHKMMAWPVVRQTLEAVEPEIPNLQNIFAEQNFPFVMLERRGLTEDLPRNSMIMNSMLGPNGHAYMMYRVEVYFNTFNLVHPVLDRQSFMSETISSVASAGFQESAESTLTCLVLALAEMALADTEGRPLSGPNSRQEGSEVPVSWPPGIDFFNEARRRMGFSLTDCTLENVQIFILAGLYYGCCSRHMEFWRMTLSASLACHALITSNSAALDTPRGDLIRRAFWHCSITESGLNLELEMPLTCLQDVQHKIDQTMFAHPYHLEARHYESHFYSQIYMRSFALDAHNKLTAAGRPTSAPSPVLPPGRARDLSGTVKSLDMQLTSWSNSLDGTLRWDTNAAAFQTHDPGLYSQAPYATEAMEGLQSTAVPTMFVNPHSIPPSIPPNIAPVVLPDAILNALLRTRYCYLKHLIWRPFIYRVLHATKATDEELDGAAQCLEACVLWPILMEPASQHKRLISCLFFWSHNILGILIILRLSAKNPRLRKSRSRCKNGFEHAAEETVIRCIEWIQDLKTVDATAEWCWTIIRGLYPEYD